MKLCIFFHCFRFSPLWHTAGLSDMTEISGMLTRYYPEQAEKNTSSQNI
ncbi:MAG: hypothetical protein E7498_08445 [Ruminococcus sp.]|nr:hypothetical protein [Ruminococcus sp.]